jgi:hypothetical protein
MNVIFSWQRFLEYLLTLISNYVRSIIINCMLTNLNRRRKWINHNLLYNSVYYYKMTHKDIYTFASITKWHTRIVIVRVINVLESEPACEMFWHTCIIILYCKATFLHAWKNYANWSQRGYWKICAIFIYASKRFMYCDVWCDNNLNLCNRCLTRIISINKIRAEKCTFTYGALIIQFN